MTLQSCEITAKSWQSIIGNQIFTTYHAVTHILDFWIVTVISGAGARHGLTSFLGKHTYSRLEWAHAQQKSSYTELQENYIEPLSWNRKTNEDLQPVQTETCEQRGKHTDSDHFSIMSDQLLTKPKVIQKQQIPRKPT